MIGNILKHPLQFDKKQSVDRKDFVILKSIKKYSAKGTIELSKKIVIAPKNLISRLNKLEKLDLIYKDKVKLKPKGWKRVWKVNESGEKWIRMFEEMMLLTKELKKQR